MERGMSRMLSRLALEVISRRLDSIDDDLEMLASEMETPGGEVTLPVSAPLPRGAVDKREADLRWRHAALDRQRRSLATITQQDLPQRVGRGQRRPAPRATPPSPVSTSVPTVLVALLGPREAERLGGQWEAHLWERVASGEYREARRDRRRLMRHALVLVGTTWADRVSQRRRA